MFPNIPGREISAADPFHPFPPFRKTHAPALPTRTRVCTTHTRARTRDLKLPSTTECQLFCRFRLVYGEREALTCAESLGKNFLGKPEPGVEVSETGWPPGHGHALRVPAAGALGQRTWCRRQASLPTCLRVSPLPLSGVCDFGVAPPEASLRIPRADISRALGSPAAPRGPAPYR